MLGMGTAEDFEVGSFRAEGLHERPEKNLEALGSLIPVCGMEEWR